MSCVFYMLNCYVYVIPLVTLSFVANVFLFKINVKYSFILSYLILSYLNVSQEQTKQDRHQAI